MESLNPVQQRIHQAALRLFVEKGGTHVNISDLAQAAGVARGTIYKNVESMEKLFEAVAAQLSKEMHERVKNSFSSITDPAHRLANGIRFFIRRAEEEPQWGAFIHRFGMADPSLRELLASQATTDVLNGLASGRYSFRQEQLVAVITMIASSVLGSILLVLEGHRAWRDPGSDAAELVLRALGVHPMEAKELATRELPELPPLV